MHPHGVGLIDLVVADPAEKFVERHPGLHPGQVCAEAEVGTAAETEQLGANVASDPEGVGVVEYPLVTVSGTGQQQHHRVGRDGGAVQGVVLRDGAGQDLARGVVAQCLLDPQRDPGAVGEQRRQLVAVAVAPVDGAAEQLGGGLVARDHHQEQERQDFLVAEPVTVDLGFQQG